MATGRPFVHGVKFEIIDLKDSSFKHTFMIEKASNYLFENDEKIGNREGVGGITLKDVPILCGGSRHPGPLGGMMNLFTKIKSNLTHQRKYITISAIVILFK